MLSLVRFFHERNHLTKGIVTLQILWSIASTLGVFITGFLKLRFSLHHQTGLWVAIGFIIINLLMIIVNAASIDQKKGLHFNLGFVIIYSVWSVDG